MGYFILQRRIVTLTNSTSQWCIQIHPLMDRNVAANVSSLNPHSLWMYRWQRKEIALACPILSDIETDKGYTCTYRFFTCLKEQMQMSLNHFKRKAYAAMEKTGLRKSVLSDQWTYDYTDGMSSNEYLYAVQRCKELGIIKTTVEPKDIPPGISGSVALIGLVFKVRN